MLLSHIQTVVLLSLSIAGTFANDECEFAVLVNTFPYQIDGDSNQSTADFPNPADNVLNQTCGIQPEGRGIWYQIESDVDQLLKATLTDAPDTSTQFNTALFVGGSCDTAECMPFRQYQMENQRTQPTSTWFAKRGESYFLHVAGIADADVGAFKLEIEVRYLLELSWLRCE
jgi:hypothetical protein